MDTAITQILIPAIAGLISGTVASLIAPWIHWGIEKNREKLNRKRELIKECRKVLDGSNFDVKSFIKTSLYSSIRSELPTKLVQEMENLEELGKERLNVVIGGRDIGVNIYTSRLSDAIASIEKRWKLI